MRTVIINQAGPFGGISLNTQTKPRETTPQHPSQTGVLKPALGFLPAFAVVVGMVIGSGIFFKPSVVFRNAGSASLGIMAWVIGGIITLTAGLTIAELAAALPRTGGLYSYLAEIYGRVWGFLLGWVQTVIYTPGAMAAQAIVFTTQLTLFLPLSDLAQRLVAVGLIALLVLLNCLSTKQGGFIQTVATIGKLIPIVLIILLGLIRGSGGRVVADVPLVAGAGLGAAVLATLWAYDGWIAVTNVAGEVHNPAKVLPRSIITGIGLVGVVYVTINLAMLRVVPIGLLSRSATPAADVTTSLFGSTGASLIAVGILISIFGALNGYTLTGARVPFAMAQDGSLPFASVLGRVHPRHGTPAATLILEGLISVFYIFVGSYNRLTDLVVFVLWLFFAMALVGVYLLRVRQPDLPRPYRVPLYPVVPAIALLGGLYILINTLFTAPGDALFGIALTLAGVPVYWLVERSRARVRG